MIREFREVDLANPSALTVFFEAHGAPRGEPFNGTMGLFDVSSVQLDLIHPELERLRRCADHVVALSKGEPTWPIWWSDVPDGVDDEELEGMSIPGFVGDLNRSLKGVHARVLVTIENADGRSHTFGDVYAGLIAALAIQLFNIVVDDEVTLKVCPVCGASFQRQRGRATQGQNRTVGVTYCSIRCARNKANRDYRKRKRQEAK